MRTRRQPTRGSVFDELAARIRQTVREVHVNELSGVERFTVQLTAPFTLGEVGGDLVLADGDPDFTVGEQLRVRLGAGQVAAGDLVWVARHDGDWHAFDVVSR